MVHPADFLYADGANAGQRKLAYEGTDIDAITLRQLYEDVKAYKFDVEFCQSALAQEDITPQESRTFQLRMFDLTHQIRHCQHRIEVLHLKTGLPARPPTTTSKVPKPLAPVAIPRHIRPAPPQRVSQTPSPVTLTIPLLQEQPRSAPTPPPAPTHSPSASPPPVIISARKRAASPDTDEEDTIVVSKRACSEDPAAASPDGSALGPGATRRQRGGYWVCRLCATARYLAAGRGRRPALPAKLPLTDVAKMMTHCLDLHGEQDAAARCRELGDALDRNRGPLEHWLTVTRHQGPGRLADIMDEVVSGLQAGRVPEVLRRLNRSAAKFPH
jgi:hypothetical protein